MAQRTQGFNMEIAFLGTSGSWPSAQRNVSATAVRRGSETILFDCGEGTQRQFQRSPFSHMSVSKIFLTHMHGDHTFGLPGYLKTMQLNERTAPLEVYGPPGTRAFMELVTRIAPRYAGYPLKVVEMEPGIPIHFDGYSVTAAQAEHSVPCFAYRLEEETRPGRFDKPRALALGVPEGPLFGRLQRGEPVTTPQGRTVRPEEVIGHPRPGRSIVVSGDTRPARSVTQLATNAQVLIHEATYTDEHQGLAVENQHSTAREAAQVARDAGVGTLWLHHFSPRYEDVEVQLSEARSVFPETHAARDLLVVDVPYPEHGVAMGITRGA